MRKAIVMPYRRIMLLTLALLGLGTVMVFGASSYEASLARGSQFGLLSKHLARVILAVMVGIVATLVPYRHSCRLAFRCLESDGEIREIHAPQRETDWRHQYVRHE